MLNTLSTSEMLACIGKPGIKILDVRSVDAYNGWTKSPEQSGGHIPGARSLPAQWCQYMDWIEMVRSKGIENDNRLILYGNHSESVIKVALMLQKAGVKDVSIYPEFEREWLPDVSLPRERLARFKQLVPAWWVNSLLKGETPPHTGSKDFVICHAHYRNPEAYSSGHIPGAIGLDTLALESPDTWNRRSPQELEQALLAHGITAHTTVVLYGKFLFPDNKDDFPGSAAGHLGALRCAFILLYAGVKDVRVLNGGFQSWVKDGFPVSTQWVSPKAASHFGTKIPARPELAVDLEEAKALLNSPQADLVCVRSYPEYIGEVSGYNYIEKKGRIPGALFSNCGSDAYHMENYTNLDHTTREFHEIEDNLRSAGVSPDKHNAFYCGTGWRGSEAFFNAYLMGWPKVSVFDGGWFEWSNNHLPFESGIPGQ